jgi:TonB family protein
VSAAELLRLMATNAVVAVALAGLAAVVSRHLRWPQAVHLLWLAVLLRMLAPAVVPVPVIPALGAPAAAGLVELGAGAAVPLAETPRWSVDPLHVVGAVWAVGALAVLVIITIRTRRLRRTLRAAAPAPQAIVARVESLASRLRVRPPRTLVADTNLPPMLWGSIGRPCVVLPGELLGHLDPDQVDALIAHELAHLARRDHWVRWLELVVTLACWWNPVTWWACRRLRHAEEHCADALVARTLPGRARAYADTLVVTLRFLAGRPTPATVGAVGMADLSEIQRRLKMILRPESFHRPPLAVRAAFTLILGVVLTVTPSLLTASPEPEPEIVPAALDATITLNLEDADIHDVFRTLSEVTGIPIMVEPGIGGRFTGRGEDIKVAEFLTIITAKNDLAWRLRDDVIEVFSTTRRTASPMVAGEIYGQPVYRYQKGVFVEPAKIAGPPPKYPEAAREDKVMGIVVLDALIDATGAVADVVVEDSPDNRLSESAMAAVRSWTFSPATLDGAPVAVRYTLTVRFSLQ